MDTKLKINMKVIRYKTFSKYDSTDRIKKMKDSDILAEDYKKTPGVSVKEVSRDLISGAVIGALAGKINELSGNKIKGLGTDWRESARKGILAAGAYDLAKDIYRKHRDGEKVEFYNKRLREAKKNAKRREESDWKNNTLNREGYTY